MRSAYLALLVLRVAVTLLAPSYLHPDEYYQSTEVRGHVARGLRSTTHARNACGTLPIGLYPHASLHRVATGCL
jgi:hypothetical protein